MLAAQLSLHVRQEEAFCPYHNLHFVLKSKTNRIRRKEEEEVGGVKKKKNSGEMRGLRHFSSPQRIEEHFKQF